MTEIHVAFATDEGYVQHLGCTIASILANAHPDEYFHFYVVDGGISEDSKQKLAYICENAPGVIQFLPVDLSKLDDCPSISYLSKSTYLRLFLPDLLPHLDKLIYLDCDMIVTDSLADLWNFDLKDKSIGVVEEFIETYSKYYLENTWRLYIPGFSTLCDKVYQTILPLTSRHHKLKEAGFNAGSLLINLAKVRQQGLFHKTIEWAEQNASILKYADQDALNVIFEDDLVKLPFKWNIQYQLCWTTIPLLKNWSHLPPFNNILDNPKGIIHYISGAKPWHYYYKTPIGDLYWKYLSLTPWKDYVPPKDKKLRGVKFRNTNYWYGLLKSFVLEVTKHFVVHK